MRKKMNLTERIELFKNAPEGATHYLEGTRHVYPCWVKNLDEDKKTCSYKVIIYQGCEEEWKDYLPERVLRNGGKLIPRPVQEDLNLPSGITTKNVYIADGEEFDTLEEAEAWHNTTLLAQELDKQLPCGEGYWLDILFDLESKGYTITKL